MGRIELELFEGQVVCDPMFGTCARGEGDAATAEALEAWAFLSTETSQFAPYGLYLYSEATREGGTRVELEVDMPVDPSRIDSPRIGGASAVRATYRERHEGVVVFEVDPAAGWGRVHGKVELARDLMGEYCPCPDGRLELVFVDPGPDEALDTSDDRHRRVSRAVFSWEDELCALARRLDAEDPGAGIPVSRIENCPWEPPGGTPTVPAGDPSRRSSSGCNDTHDDVTVDGSSGCGAGCDDSSSSSSGGCDDGGRGCEGDTSDSSGCEGDSGDSSGCSGDDAACEADPGAASMGSLSRSRPRCARRRVLDGPVQTFALTAGALWFYRRRRA